VGDLNRAHAAGSYQSLDDRAAGVTIYQRRRRRLPVRIYDAQQGYDKPGARPFNSVRPSAGQPDHPHALINNSVSVSDGADGAEA